MRRGWMNMKRMSVSLACLLGLASIGLAQDRPPGSPTQPPPTGGPPAAAPAPASQPKLEGDMRVELLGVVESRTSATPGAPERFPKPGMRVYFKLTGARLMEVFKHSKLFIDEMTDETGAKLIDPAVAFPAKDRGEMMPANLASPSIQDGYIILDIQPNVPSRGAKKIAKLSGYINLIFGGAADEIVIDNPVRFEGALIDDPRLAAAGVKVRVLKAGSEYTDGAENKGVALRFEEGEDKVKSVDFYDDWYRKINIRQRPIKTSADLPAVHFASGNARLDGDSQIVLSIFKSVDKKKVDLKIENLDLP